MSESPNDTDAGSADNMATAKTRSPIERAVVWTLIGGLGVLLGVEYLSLNSYNTTLAALDRIRSDPEAMVSLSEARKTMISGSPSEATRKGSASTEIVELKWFSLFKDYRVSLITESGENDPIVIAFSTPIAPQEAASETPLAVNDPLPGDPRAMGAMPGEAMMTPGQTGGPGATGGRPPQSGRGRRRAPGMLGDVQQEWVQAELGMTPEQIEKLPGVAQAVLSGVDFASFREMTEDQRQAARQELESKIEAGVKDVLDEEQFGRARQLMLQRMGPAAFSRADVALELGLDDSQRQQAGELTAQIRLAQRELGFGASPQARDEAAATFNGLLLDMLTDDQTGKWQGMLGAPPEKGPEEEPPRRPQRPTGE